MSSPPRKRTGQNPHAILLGLDSMTGLQAARILAGNHVPVIAVANDLRHYNCRTRVCEQIFGADTASEELIDLLLKIGPQLDERAVLVPCEDWNILNVSRHREELGAWYCFAMPEPEVVELIFDKVQFYNYVRQQGLPMPGTFILESREDAEQAANSMTYPCVLKPPGRTEEWELHVPEKAFKARTSDELLAFYDEFHNWAPRLIAQEWIEGPDSNIYSCYCCFDAASQPLATFTARKIRQWPPEVGMSCLGEECRNDIVLDTALQLFKGVRLHGIGHLEMKRDERTGQHLIVEAHVVRPTGRSPISEAGGVPLLYTMYCDALGWPLPPNPGQQYGSVKWIHIRRDIQSALYYWRRHELTIGDWVRSWRGLKAHAVFSWSDPGPFIADLARALGLFLRGERKL